MKGIQISNLHKLLNWSFFFFQWKGDFSHFHYLAFGDWIFLGPVHNLCVHMHTYACKPAIVQLSRLNLTSSSIWLVLDHHKCLTTSCLLNSPCPYMKKLGCFFLGSLSLKETETTTLIMHLQCPKIYPFSFYHVTIEASIIFSTAF